jgi:uncharacterized membrane-anchored protein
VSGVCVTNKTGFVFHDRMCWTFIQLVTTIHKSLSDTLSSSTGHSHFTNPLYSIVLPCTPSILIWTTTDSVLSQSYFTTGPLKITTSDFIFQLNTFGYPHSPYATSSFTRGWVCHLQLLLALVSAVILRADSRGTHDPVLLSQILDSPNLEGQVPIFISSRKRVAQLYRQSLG